MNGNNLVYLESDEEITSVIDKISRVSESEAYLVIPRGGNIAQSIVNLKLLKKRSTDLGKDVSLVTTDKISRNLASQVGISVYSRVEEIGKRKSEPKVIIPPPVTPAGPETIKSEVPAPEAARPAEELPELPGVKIHRYYDAKDHKPKVESPETKASPSAKKTEISKAPIEETVELPTGELAGSDLSPSKENENKHREVGIDTGFTNRKIEEKPAENLAESMQPDTPEKPIHHQPMKPGRRFQPIRRRRVLFILLASILVIILAFSYLILPQAQATIIFKADGFDELATVHLDAAATSINEDNLTSPATLSSVDKEVSDTFQATGTKNIGNKATGQITLFNAGSSSAQKIDAGHGLSYDGKKFTINASVTIPGATVSGGNIVPGQATGEVTATDSGEAYNLAPVKSPNKLVLDSYPSTQTWAQSNASFSGGSTKNVAVIQASDITGAQDKIKARLSSEAKEEVLKKVPSIDKYVEGTIEESYSDLKSSSPADTQADNFTYSGKVKTTVLTFNETNLKEVIVKQYQEKLPENRVMVQQDSLNFNYTVVDKNITAGLVNYSLKYSGKISSRIDEDGLKNQLRGKTIDEAKTILGALDLVKDVSIKMTPNLSFYKTLPLLSRSIKIETVYEAE